MIGVCVGEDPPGTGFHHELHGLEDGHSEAGDAAGVPQHPAVLLEIVPLRPLVSLTHFPQFDCFI